MASHSQDNPHTLSTPKTSNSPQTEEEHLFSDIPYTLPHEELNQFRRITRAYARQIDVFPLALLLPRRKKIRRPMVESLDPVFVHTVEDLIDFSLTKIKHPLNLISKHQPETAPSPMIFSTIKSLTQNAQARDQMTWKITMIIAKKGENHLKIINLGWPYMLWLSLDEYITFPDIQKNYSLNLTMKPRDFLKTISKNSY
jgi:hypothetical protein